MVRKQISILEIFYPWKNTIDSRLKGLIPNFLTGMWFRERMGKDAFDVFSSWLTFFNTLTLKSDWFLISPYNMASESNIKVLRVKETITN